MKTQLKEQEETREENFDLIDRVDKGVRKSLEIYIDHIFEYNKMVNIISRQITGAALKQLMNETLLLETYVSNQRVIDAGSGSGILGIPIAIMNPERRVYLVETKKKKVFFLEKVKEEMILKNIIVIHKDIREFDHWIKNERYTLIARGFPGFDIFIDFLVKGLINEAVLITSLNKIKKIKKDMVNVKKKTYNVPLRNQIKILKMENVSRET